MLRSWIAAQKADQVETACSGVVAGFGLQAIQPGSMQANRIDQPAVTKMESDL